MISDVQEFQQVVYQKLVTITNCFHEYKMKLNPVGSMFTGLQGETSGMDIVVENCLEQHEIMKATVKSLHKLIHHKMVVF